MIVRINYSKVPYYMFAIKNGSKPGSTTCFGNLGKIVGDPVMTSRGLMYNLQSCVDPTLFFNFYEHEIIKEG